MPPRPGPRSTPPRPTKARGGPAPTVNALGRLVTFLVQHAVIGRLAPVAGEQLVALGAGDGDLGARERLVVIVRGRKVFRPAAIADQGVFAIGADDHGSASLRAAQVGFPSAGETRPLADGVLHLEA